MDDSRLSDEEFDNNNDIKVSKEGMRYDVQTYLNTEIGEKEINDTLEDMGNEGLKYGLIVTNMIVNDEVKKKQLICILEFLIEKILMKIYMNRKSKITNVISFFMILEYN